MLGSICGCILSVINLDSHHIIPYINDSGTFNVFQANNNSFLYVFIAHCCHFFISVTAFIISFLSESVNHTHHSDNLPIFHSHLLKNDIHFGALANSDSLTTLQGSNILFNHITKT